jgi:hypothetical protein
MGALLTVLQTLKHEVYDYWKLKRIKNWLCAQKQITIGDEVRVYYITILWQVYIMKVSEYGDTAYTWELSSHE